MQNISSLRSRVHTHICTVSASPHGSGSLLHASQVHMFEALGVWSKELDAHGERLNARETYAHVARQPDPPPHTCRRCEQLQEMLINLCQ